MRKHMLYFTIAALFVIGPFVLSGCGEKTTVSSVTGPVINTEAESAPSDSTTFLNVATPMTLAEVGQYAQQHGLKVLEVRMQWPGYVVGFQLNGRDPATAAETFAQEHRKFLMVLMSKTDTAHAPQRKTAIAELSRMDNIPLRISSMTVEGAATHLQHLPGVAVSQHPLSTDDPGPRVDPHPLKRIVEPHSLYHQSWAPYTGTSEVNRSYSYQWFMFNDLSKLGSSMATYEHETHVWDKNYANQTGYWASNMPNAYLDCGNFESVDNFAVGTFTANQLRTYVWYYTYIGLYGQSSSSSTVSIWAQRGTRWSWSCWNVYSNEHAGPLTTHGTGGGICWQF